MKKIDSTIFGSVNLLETDLDQEELIPICITITKFPVNVFQELNRYLNMKGMMLKIEELP